MNLDFLQYAFIPFALSGALLVTWKSARVRFWGFLSFLFSNIMLITWCVCQRNAWGILFVYILFSLLAIKGLITTSRERKEKEKKKEKKEYISLGINRIESRVLQNAVEIANVMARKKADTYKEKN